MNQRHFGRKSEANLSEIDGQISLSDSFNEAEYLKQDSSKELELKNMRKKFMDCLNESCYDLAAILDAENPSIYEKTDSLMIKQPLFSIIFSHFLLMISKSSIVRTCSE